MFVWDEERKLYVWDGVPDVDTKKGGTFAFRTLAEMAAYPEENLPPVFSAVCLEDGNSYNYRYNNEPGSLGRWRKVGDGGGGGIPEAPVDGRTYGRKNAAWAEVSEGGAVGFGDIQGHARDNTDLAVELDGRVSKIEGETENDQAYVKRTNGEQTMANIDENGLAYSLPRRGGDGSLKTEYPATPSAKSVVNKMAMESALAGKQDAMEGITNAEIDALFA